MRALVTDRLRKILVLANGIENDSLMEHLKGEGPAWLSDLAPSKVSLGLEFAASCEVFGVGGSKFTCGTWDEGTSGGCIAEEEGTEEANAGAPSSADTCSDDEHIATGTAFASASLTAGTTSGMASPSRPVVTGTSSGTASPSSPVSPTGMDCNATSLTGTSITSGADVCSEGGEEGSASTSITIGKAPDEGPATGFINNWNFEKMKNLPAGAGVLNSARSRRA